MTAIKIRVTVQIRYLAPEVMERQGRGTTARGVAMTVQLQTCGVWASFFLFCYQEHSLQTQISSTSDQFVALMITKCGTVSV